MHIKDLAIGYFADGICRQVRTTREYGPFLDKPNLPKGTVFTPAHPGWNTFTGEVTGVDVRVNGHFYFILGEDIELVEGQP